MEGVVHAGSAIKSPALVMADADDEADAAAAEEAETRKMLQYYNLRLQKLYEKYDEQSRQMEKHLREAEDEDCGIKHGRMHEQLARDNQREMSVLAEVILSIKQEISDITDTEPNWLAAWRRQKK